MEGPVENAEKIESVKFLKKIIGVKKIASNIELQKTQNLDNTNLNFENAENIVNTVNVENKTEVPAKVITWSKIKAFLFQEIKFGFKPKTEAKLQEAHDFWHQDITTEKVHNFLFQKIKFKK